MPAVRSVALMTHFANADLAGGADESMELFAAAVVSYDPFELAEALAAELAVRP